MKEIISKLLAKTFNSREKKIAALKGKTIKKRIDAIPTRTKNITLASKKDFKAWYVEHNRGWGNDENVSFRSAMDTTKKTEDTYDALEPANSEEEEKEEF